MVHEFVLVDTGHQYDAFFSEAVGVGSRGSKGGSPRGNSEVEEGSVFRVAIFVSKWNYCEELLARSNKWRGGWGSMGTCHGWRSPTGG